MTDLPIKHFKTQPAWREWLEKNHTSPDGIWVQFYKKASGVGGLNYDQALDEALCYGWIDGQVKKYDEQSWLQKFTPRRARSNWSKRNVDHTERLIKTGKMQPAGLKEIERAKQDGRWQQAYDSQANMVIPADFLKELAKDKKAETFFQTLNKSNKYAIGWRLQTAKKPETRERRMKVLLEMMSKGEKLY